MSEKIRTQIIEGWIRQNEKNGKQPIPGIFAVGDVRLTPLRQK